MPKYKYTQADWARIQSRLPEEDRVPYSESPTVPTLEESQQQLLAGIAESKQTSAEQNIISKEATLDKAIITKDEEAIKKAALELERAKAAAEGEKVDPNAVVQTQITALQEINDKPTLTPEQERLGFQVKWIGGVNGRWQVIRPSAEEVQLRIIQENLNKTTTDTTTTTTTTTDTTTDTTTSTKLMPGFTAGQLPADLQSIFGANPNIIGYKLNRLADGTYAVEIQIGDGSTQTFGAKVNLINGKYVVVQNAPNIGGTSDIGGTNNNNVTDSSSPKYYTYDPATGTYKPVSSTTSTNVTNLTAEEYNKRTNAMSGLISLFSRYGLESLIPTIRTLAMEGAGEDTIALRLQDTPEYKLRFSANTDRIKKGLKVLDPGTYLALEDRYRQIIRAYGLKQFDNDNYVQQFIANDVSPEEVSSRVVNAVQRVQNADPAVSAMLRQYYNIGVTDMVAYVLDPTNQLPKIERQIGAAEIGVAAGRQGLTAGVNVAEQLAAQGVTEAEARRGYSTIADILPQATKLSQIYTGVLDQYGQAEAEQEVFNSLASAQRKRRALVEREIASFSGASGLSKTALDRQTGGQY
jgi:hypothetical protein